MYLNSITNLRAMAIVLIVGAHTYGISDFIQNDFLNRLVFNLTYGSTIIFVFISGFLYHHVFYLKGRTKIFLKKRATRLLIPYLILSILPILYRLHYEPDFWSNIIPKDKAGIFYEYIYPAFLFLISGDHLVAYWYIPFAMLLFLCYPLHTAFIKSNLKVQIVIMLLTLFIALFVPRPLPKSLLVVQSLVYFTPAYLFGIICSIKKDKVYSVFKGKEYMLFMLFLVVLLFQTFLGIRGNNHNAFYAYEGIDSFLPQKIFLCLFLMVWLHRFENYANKYVWLLANTSFAIYFLHGYVLRVFYLIKGYLGIEEFSHPLLAYLISTIMLITFSMAAALILKKIFKKKSTYITGY